MWRCLHTQTWQQLHIFSSLVKVRVCGGLNLPQTASYRSFISMCYISPRIPIVEGCSPISKRHLFFHHGNHIPFTFKLELEGQKEEAGVKRSRDRMQQRKEEQEGGDKGTRGGRGGGGREVVKGKGRKHHNSCDRRCKRDQEREMREQKTKVPHQTV